MTKKMLIDATHEEETRVAVVDGNRLTDFDYESAFRKQLKGSIFLAKVTRVEPSLQAAFVNFGGNRHGFLPFSEIHPDYFRIPISDREALIAEQEAEMEARRAAEEAEDLEDDDDDAEEADNDDVEEDDDSEASDDDKDDNKNGQKRGRGGRGRGGRGGRNKGADNNRKVEIVGGDGIEGDQPQRPVMRKNYKIQEVVKRGQIMLIQVSKEERGNKGAAVGTYLSLPGRYCVLMPNSPRAGGVSRKIANFKERKRMREILRELQVPQGMSVIMRTAGVSRTKAEIKRDLDYLMKLWDGIRSKTLESTAPAMIHEEGSLVRRAIRDIYTRDVDEIHVSGDEGYKKARDVIKMMIPSHAKKVKQYKDDQIPLFQRYQIESQISEIGDPVVTLPSGGYLVINPTEALVSVDVNSGRATKERHIEETALRTNMEAAEEVARQLRLRDLGGLVVVDFIDMENRRNNRKVENKIKDALSTDRARIQIGRISTFGLMELSRQRMNPSLTEAQFEKCAHCQGVGVVRSVDATAINAIRALEEEGTRNRSEEVTLTVSNAVALYILNNKRKQISEIEERYGFALAIVVQDDIGAQGFKIDVQKTDNCDSNDNNTNQQQQTQQNQSNNSNNQNQRNGDDEDGQQEKRRSRRGRRGGRNRRGRNRRDNENTENSETENNDGNQNLNDSGKEDKADTSDKKDEKQEDKKSKSSRGRGRSKKVDTQKNDDKKAVADTPESDNAPKEEKADAPQETKRKSTRKAATQKPSKKTDEKTDKAEAPSEKKPKKTTRKPPAKKVAAADKEEKSKDAPAPSNDSAPEPKEYEVVNEAPDKKKKGWWSRSKD